MRETIKGCSLGSGVEGLGFKVSGKVWKDDKRTLAFVRAQTAGFRAWVRGFGLLFRN